LQTFNYQAENTKINNSNVPKANQLQHLQSMDNSSFEFDYNKDLLYESLSEAQVSRVFPTPDVKGMFFDVAITY